jgi:hypothetical protein
MPIVIDDDVCAHCEEPECVENCGDECLGYVDGKITLIKPEVGIGLKNEARIESGLALLFVASSWFRFSPGHGCVSVSCDVSCDVSCEVAGCVCGVCV